MTVEQFKPLRAGDVVVGLHHQRRERKIYAISKVQGQRGQTHGKPRYCFTVSNLKSNGSLFFSPEIGAARFEFPENR